MKLIDEELLHMITAEAKASERKRKNYNFHDSLDAPCQRLLNALEPDTVVPTHRHLQTAETYIIVSGSLEVVFYNDRGEVTDSVVLSQKSGNRGVHIPVGQWHSIKVLESGTVIFEAKDGPYMSIGPDDILHV